MVNIHLRQNQKTITWEILDWIFPPSCCGCGTKGAVICPSCQRSLTYVEEPVCQICGKPFNPLDGCKTCQSQEIHFTSARAAFLFQGIVREAIHQLKYSGNLEISRVFANFLLSVYLKQNWEPDFVIAVPLSKGKMNERGFNQSEWIAKPLAKAIRKPYLKGALRKKQDTDSQVGLGRMQRIENLRGAFQAEPILVKGKNILVIDDVMTTGSTFNECAETLKASGAKDVFCLSVATTDSLKD